MSRAWPLVAAVLCACLLAGSARAQPASEAERDFYTDRALEALANGDLERAERVLAAAAALPGDPARRATVASLGARVHDLRLRRGETVVRQLPPAAAASQRAPLLSLTSLLGFGLYGWAVPLSLGIDSGESTRTFVGAYMVTASSSFVLPYLLTREAAVTPAQVNLAFYGGTRGGWHGVLVGALLAGDLSPEIRQQAWSASLLAGSVTELVAGYALAPVAAPTPGRARTLAAVGDLGLLLGFGAGYLLRFDQKETADARARAMAGAGLAGAAVGLGGGYALGAHRHLTWGDGEVLRASWALGGWTGAAAADLASLDLSLDDRTFTALMMAGGALGLWAGDALVRDARFTVGESLLVDLGTLAGGLLGAGIALLADSNHGPTVFASGLGAVVGFGLSYWLAPERRPRSSRVVP